MAENNESIIDLTDCSYTLADHYSLNNIVINLDTDDSFREEASNASNTTTGSCTERKRRYTRTRPIVSETPVHDLCTPENKTKKRRSNQCNKKADKVSIPKEPVEEPKEKKTKLQFGCCPICFDEFCGQALASTKCGHVFCMDCLKLALKRESRCPTCRTVLKGNLKYHAIFL